MSIIFILRQQSTKTVAPGALTHHGTTNLVQIANIRNIITLTQQREGAMLNIKTNPGNLNKSHT